MKQAAKKRINTKTTAELVELFEATENNTDETIPTVRGWIMDALENRDAGAFDAWIDSCENSPRRFFA